MDKKAVYAINRRFYGWIYRFVYFVLRHLVPQMKVYGRENLNLEEPAVYISRHMNGYGPYSVLGWADIPRLRMWALGVFMQRDTCYKQYADYTFSQRLGWPRWLSCAAAWVCSRIVPWFDHSMRELPVYRGSKDIVKTMKMTVEALQAGDNVLVMPERDITDGGEQVSEVYGGFVQIGRLYCKACGKPSIAFYPIYTDAETKSVHIRPAVTFYRDRPWHEERDRVLEELRHGMSADPKKGVRNA